ncbi:MAG: polysaccharide biosynthesis protein [Phycisphaerales bacterium]|nr:polysaccharide biosynthesis protein [Hyphomonadaceae bacterium]
MSGAAILGKGDSALPVCARAGRWDEFDFTPLNSRLLILAAPPGDGAEGRAIVERAAEARMKVLLIENGQTRPMRLEDMIGCRLGAIDEARIRNVIAGKRVLITGAGGSIGSELARRLATLSPARLTLLDSSEYNLFRISQELPSSVPVLADIRDQHAMRRWFKRERPEMVFHAAALKQVPLVEMFPSEGVLTNVGGVRNVAEAAHGVGADLVFVSTDKAVDPSGVMGASKRLGELYCQALDRRGGLRAVPLRLGNVLGSTGSVIPTFEAQLAGGGPLTITDPEVTRFFLSIPQAADALLQAAAVGLTAPVRGAALVIEMGEALPVVELAREVIRLEGLRPDVDVSVVFTGLRPGEKLHEALIGAEEWREADPAPNVIAVGSPPRALAELCETMDRLLMLAREGADNVVARELFDAIAGAAPAEEPRALAG